MMDKKRHKQQPGTPPEWRLQPGLEESTEVDSQALEQLEQQFLLGIAKAKRRAQPRMTMSVGLRWALAGAMLFALVALGPLVIPEEASLVAAPYPGMQGQVVSAVDDRAVSGVEVWLKDDQPWLDSMLDRDPGKLVAVTNDGGFFELKAGQLNGPRQVILKHAGKEVAKFNQLPGEHDFKYGQKIWIEGSGAEPDKFFKLDLAPGRYKRTAAGVTISLDSSVGERWKGYLVRDQRWPAAFSYGCIIDGVYSLRGEASPGLEMKVRLDEEVLKMYHATPEDVVLVVFNSEYGQKDGNRGFHRGWYCADQPPEGYSQPTITTKLTYDKHGNASLAWPAEPGVRYALKVPMHVDGKLDFVNFYANGTDITKGPEQRLMLLDQNHPQLYTVKVFNRPADKGVWQEATSQPRVHQPFYELANADNCVKQEEDGKVVPFGQWRIQLLDFTLQELHNFDIDAPAVLPEPGKFQLELTPGEVGGMSTARVTGELDRLAKPPAWSFSNSYYDEKYGEVIELPAPYPSSYKVQVTLREKNGAVSVLCGSIDVTNPSLSLYYGGMFNSVPVLDCTQSQPANETHVQAITATALANPLPYGYCVSDVAGPVWRCRLPDEYTGVPLTKVRIVQYASPMAGDVSTVELQPVLGYTPREQLSTMVASVGGWLRPDGKRADLCNEGLSHVVKYAVYHGELNLDLHEFLSAGYHYENHVAPNVAIIKDKLGWDLDNLPANEQLFTEAKAFKESYAYGRRPVTQSGQQLIWEFDMEGVGVPPGEDLVLRYSIETMGLLVAAQWDLQSTPEHPSYIEVYVEGQPEPWRGYFDYSPMMTD